MIRVVFGSDGGRGGGGGGFFLGGGGSSRCVDVVCSFDVDICLIRTIVIVISIKLFSATTCGHPY